LIRLRRPVTPWLQVQNFRYTAASKNVMAPYRSKLKPKVLQRRYHIGERNVLIR